MTNIAIIILTYNALEYVTKCIESVHKKTKYINFTTIVVDNNSNQETKNFLFQSLLENKIDLLCCLESNRFWSKGNNIGYKIIPDYCDKILLLNSDVEILDDLWLFKLNNIHKPGLTSYGYIASSINLNLPNRADGYCVLIDRYIYDKYKLDENFPWFYSISKMQSQILDDGFSVQAIKYHKNVIHHYGGKSSKNKKQWAKNFTKIDADTTKKWFTNTNNITIIEKI
jgi:glycosyltransferase involved in cell wall biosynthesis